MTERQHERRRRVRRRRLIAGVVILDIVGAGALAYALASPGQSSTPAGNHAHAGLVSAVANAPGYTLVYPGASTAGAEPTSTTSTAHSSSVSRSTASATSIAADPPRPARTPPRRKRVVVSPLDVRAAISAARAERADGLSIGFALVASYGEALGSFRSSTENYGGSITKSMLLVAYLRQSATAGLSPAARSELTSMIEVSDNGAADWVYAHLRSPQDAVLTVARDAGMTGFRLDLSDPVYVLGQSLVTAHDFASLFAAIAQLMPASQRSFGMYLLAHVQERVGLLAAGLPGVVYAKEGWKPENEGQLGSPFIVNQAARFTDDGTTYGVAVTVGGASDQTDAEAVVQRIVSALR